MRSRSNRNLEVLIFETRGKPEYQEKNQEENQQQTQPIDVGISPGPHSWVTVRSHHWTTLVPLPPTLAFINSHHSIKPIY